MPSTKYGADADKTGGKNAETTNQRTGGSVVDIGAANRTGDTGMVRTGISKQRLPVGTPGFGGARGDSKMDPVGSFAERCTS